MRAIALDFFARSPFMAGPLLAMLIFLGVFVAVLARLWLRGSKSYDDAAQLPLFEETPSQNARRSTGEEVSS